MEEFEEDLVDTLVMAHNASFDMSVLKASYQLYGTACPNIDYICTLKLAKKVWHNLASYRLNEVSRYIDFSFKYYNVAEDAHACGELALAAARKLNVSSLRHLPIKLDMTMGRFHLGGYPLCSVKLPAKAENR